MNDLESRIAELERALVRNAQDLASLRYLINALKEELAKSKQKKEGLQYASGT